MSVVNTYAYDSWLFASAQCSQRYFECLIDAILVQFAHKRKENFLLYLSGAEAVTEGWEGGSRSPWKIFLRTLFVMQDSLLRKVTFFGVDLTEFL